MIDEAKALALFLRSSERRMGGGGGVKIEKLKS
jgi:hypothetical protein